MLGVLITNFIKASIPIFNVYHILQYLHLDVQRNLFHNIHGIVIYISYYDYVLSLKMALTAKTRCWWLIIDKVVFRPDLHLFYLSVYLNTMGMPSLKKYRTNYCISIATIFMQTSHNVMWYAQC